MVAPTVWRLWFDVGFKRYTTRAEGMPSGCTLWFDVGFKRYTTGIIIPFGLPELWFDVGFKRYTTFRNILQFAARCGLM